MLIKNFKNIKKQQGDVPLMITQNKNTKTPDYNNEIEFELNEQVLFDKHDILTIRLNDKQLECIDSVDYLIKQTPYPVIIISFELINQPTLHLIKIIDVIKNNQSVKFFFTNLNKEEQMIVKNAIDFVLSSKDNKM